MPESLDAWFQREILPQEAALLRYLNRVWTNREEVHDLRQEIYVRVYEAAKNVRPASARAFLFATAKNLVTDRIRRARIVSIEAVGNPDALNVIVDELSPERRLSAWQELRRVARAFNRLPPRCREVVWLRKVDQMTNKQIAQRLRLSPRTVEGQMLKGMQLLGSAVFGHQDDEPAARADDATHARGAKPAREDEPNT